MSLFDSPYRAASSGFLNYGPTSLLKIRKLTTTDEGSYECKVRSTHGDHEFSSNAMLIVALESGMLE